MQRDSSCAFDSRSAEPRRERELSKSGRSRSTSVTVALLVSRLLGFVRARAVAHFGGSTIAADLVAYVLRGGNQLQVLLGEQALSASFIPLYSRFLGDGRDEDARRFAGASLGLLTVASALGVALGVVFAPWLVAISYPGHLTEPETVDLIVRGVRYVFPMAGVLVVSAWCLAVLTSHHRFFLPYAAPALWNLSTIGVLVIAMRGRQGEEDPTRLVLAVCAGALLGGLAQLGVQLPTTLKVLGGLRLSLSRRVEGIDDALRRFVPAVLARGSGSLSGWLDFVLASFLATGAAATLERAQRLYLLPIALFATAVAVVELPELSRLGDDERRELLGQRLAAAFRRASFLVVPTMVGFLLFGVSLVGAVYQSGRFGRADALLVAVVLATYSVGLVPASASRLLQNGFFVWGDTKTPAVLGFLRVALAGLIGGGTMLLFDRISVAQLNPELQGGGGLFLGAVGLALGSACGSWFEMLWLARRLKSRHGGAPLPWSFVVRCVLRAACLGIPIAWLTRGLNWHPALVAALTVGIYALGYLGWSSLRGVPEAQQWLGRFSRLSSRLRGS
ncbi:MAG: murein biosynthesis integral membrane protein MurJ [Acidobacteriota bacterium]